MSSIKLKHSSGNSMSIAAPATNPASDLELKLPAAVGSANQLLKNSGTAGTLEFASNVTVDSDGLNVSKAEAPSVVVQNSTDTSYGMVKLQQSSGSGGYFAIAKLGTSNSSASGANAAELWQSGNAPIVIATNGSERMRIRANGTMTSNHGSNSITAGGFAQANYFAKQFAASNHAGLQLEANGNDAIGGLSQNDDNLSFFNSYRSSAGYLKAEFRIGGGIRMTIATNGLISGDFNDTSDAKLKENVASIADGALGIIKQLRPVTFDWKNLGKEEETGHDSITGPKNVSGFLAQEVKPLIPSVVEGTEWDESEPNGDRYSINTNGLVAHLTKALQEAITKIETLETKVAALEAG